MNPFANIPVVGKFKPGVYMDPVSKVLYKYVDAGYGFSYSEALPDDQQVGGLPDDINPPSTGDIPDEMYDLIKQGDKYSDDGLLATSCKSFCDKNAGYNEHVVFKGYVYSMKFWQAQPEQYEEPIHPRVYWRPVSYKGVYAAMKLNRVSGGSIPLPPECNYSLVRRRTR
jgi:hypothetical protein